MTEPGPAPSPVRRHTTAPADPDASWDRFDRLLRMVAIAVIGVLVTGALAGIAGLRTSTVTAANTTFSVEALHASVSRPGLSTPLRVTVRSIGPGSLPDTVSVSIGDDYLSMFDQNGVQPTPDTSAFDGETVTWTFRIDDEPELVVDVDARLQPNIHRGRDATVTVSSPGDEPVSVSFHTRVFG